MPAIQVARTDTFELQRQKINQIGQQIFNISAGGSDLSTGNLKLGNGTKEEPSLAFVSDSTLGFYKHSASTLGVVSSEKLISTHSFNKTNYFTNLEFTKNSLTASGLVIQSSGQNYDPGSYTGIAVLGGSGINGTLGVVVEAFIGDVTSYGEDYKYGSFSGVLLEGGTGSGATFNFSVAGIEGSITNGGSNYDDGIYADISITNGSGSGAKASINVSSGSISSINITNNGVGYRNGDTISVDASQIGDGSGSGFVYTITNYPGKVGQGFTFLNKGSGYSVGDVLTLPTGRTNVSTTLDDTSTNITVSSATGIYSGYIVTQVSGTGVLQDPSGGGIAGGSSIPITVSGVFGNQITLSNTPDTSGTAVLNFLPPFGVGSTPFEYEVNSVGSIASVSVTNGGTGYSVGDSLSLSSFDLTQPIGITVTVVPVSVIEFTMNPSIGSIAVGDSIRTAGGSIQTTSITTSTTIAGQSGQTYTNLSPSSQTGGGSGAVFNISRGFTGDPTIQVVSGGLGYSAGGTITFLGSLVGGVNGTDDITISIESVSAAGSEYEVYAVKTGTNIESIVCAQVSFNVGSVVVKSGTTSPGFTVDTITPQNHYFLNDGSGAEYTPNLTLYVNNKYRFNNSQNSSHPLRFSEFRDGTWAPSLVENISTTLDISSKVITVTDTTGILPGMIVTSSSTGGGGTGGSLGSTTYVDSVDSSTQITLTEFPTSSGLTTLTFRGYPITDGVSTTSSYTEILVSELTPSPLYYYCQNHPNMGGIDGLEGQLTINQNNPKVFGSGLQISVIDILSTTVGSFDIANSKFTVLEIDSPEASIDTLEVSTSLNAPSITGDAISLNSISSTSNLTISNPGNLSITTTNFSIGSLFSIVSSTGNLTTSGEIKTLSILNVNDVLKLENNVISSVGTNDITLSPASGRIAKINSTSALVIPSGTSNQRPGQGIKQNGSIRFNTESNQYEGYTSATDSWASLGGVRDIDGNTYIIAELTTGANDNTLWFYNDNNNTLRLTTQFLDFRSVKKISSGRLGLPTFSTWSSNTPVTVGSYLKYRNNIYEVTVGGTTASSGNEPTHTTGATANGTAELTWYSLSVSPLEFTEIEELRIGPNKDCPLVISAEIKLFNQTISTLTGDLIIQPALGKKVVVDSTTHFTIPAGNDNQKSTATAQAGSIRYNTTISQFEGYSGTNWSSLGGVRDVDGNTYIIPETAPGANENILYFYNDNLNTVQLTKTTLDFTNIDTITTSGLGTLALDTPLVTLNLDDTTIDNRDVTRTFISTSKQYLDLGLSTGLVVDPVLRLDDEGDVYLNTGFGTGSFVGVKIFDGDLKEFELADYGIKTSTFSMEKGNSSTTAVLLYALSSVKGCQVSVMSKASTGKKSLATYNVIDNGSDIFHNEFGSLNTSADGFSATFDITPEGETRITLALSNDHSNGDIVEFTVITQVYK